MDENSVHHDQEAGVSPSLKWRWALGLLVVVPALLFRVHMQLSGRLYMDSDQAIPGLGALRLLRGGEWRVYMEGQNYAADILSYWLAPFHLIFPPSPALLRLGMLPLTVLFWWSLWLCARRLIRSEIAGLVTLLLVAYPSDMILDWTMHSGSVYTVMLTFISFAVIALQRLVRSHREGHWSSAMNRDAALVGLFFGVAFWIHFSTLITMLATAVTLLLCPRFLRAFLGFEGERPTERRSALTLVMHAITIGGLLFATYLHLIRGKGQYGLLALFIAGLLAWWRRHRSDHLRRDASWGLEATVAGLWVGAFPVLLHNLLADEKSFFDQSQTVESLAVVWTQMRSVFTQGIPVLMGTLHDYAHPAIWTPAWLRVPSIVFAFAVMVVMMGVVWARRGKAEGERFAPMLLTLTVLAQVVLFAMSVRGDFVISPRYLFTLFWALALGFGLAAQLLWCSGLAGRVVTVAVVLVMMGNSLAMNLERIPQDLGSRDGTTRTDAALLEFLRGYDLHRVSARFAGLRGHWLAWKFSYMSGGEVKIGQQDWPHHPDVRCLDWQREVDTDPQAYLMSDRAPIEHFVPWLESLGVQFESERVPPHTVYWNLEPDLLRDLTMKDYQAFIDGHALD